MVARDLRCRQGHFGPYKNKIINTTVMLTGICAQMIVMIFFEVSESGIALGAKDIS